MENALSSDPQPSSQRHAKGREPPIRSAHGSSPDKQGQIIGQGVQAFGQPFVISNIAMRGDVPVAIHNVGELSLGQANFSQHPASVNSFTSPAFMLQNSRIGDVSMSTSFLQEATHILSLYNQECQQKLLIHQKEKEFELRIIAQSLKKAQQDQLQDLNQSMKFEVQTVKQTLISEAEGDLAEQKAQMVHDKEVLLLQREDFARKSAELEAERILREY